MVEEMEKLDLEEELRKVQKEMGGPFFNKKDNRKWRKEQEKFNRKEEQRRQRQQTYEEHVEKIQPKDQEEAKVPKNNKKPDY